MVDFNPRSPDGERRREKYYLVRYDYFNPRSPDGERLFNQIFHVGFPCISIHAPRMGSDKRSSTPDNQARNFNPRSPDGERREVESHWNWGSVFQSTLPGWGATRASQAYGDTWQISIHAPRMGSDRENGHLRPRYGQNHPFSTLIVSQIVVDVLGTVRKSQKTPAH